MKILGIDYGLVRVGISISDEGGTFALPHSVVQNDQSLVVKLEELINQEKIKTIVIGYTGEGTDVEEGIKELLSKLTKPTVTIIRQGEHGSSMEAVRFQGFDKEKVDASAAAIILQRYLDTVPKETPKISIDDVKKVEISVGLILSAEKMMNADKLLKLSVDFNEGTPRTIVSGISSYFQDPHILVGVKCMFITNLAPRPLKGEVSNGMILALSTPDGAFSLLKPDQGIPQGTKAK